MQRISEYSKDFPSGLDTYMLEAEATSDNIDSWILKSFSDEVVEEVTHNYAKRTEQELSLDDVAYEVLV